jgi:uncharacterized membrane protein
MENKIVGYLIIGVAALIGVIVYSFNQALVSIVSATCTHGSSCSMWTTIDFQNTVSIGIIAFIAVIGLYLILSDRGKAEKRELSEKKDYADAMKQMDAGEKKVFEEILKDGTIFQSELREKTGMSKVKITRILDRLEGRQLVERRRRGMTNVVVLK